MGDMQVDFMWTFVKLFVFCTKKKILFARAALVVDLVKRSNIKRFISDPKVANSISARDLIRQKPFLSFLTDFLGSLLYRC